KHEVVAAADHVGSTEHIIKTLEAAPAGSAWAIGTELNLVRRLAKAHPDKQIVFLDKTVCFCSTMNRIDLPHLVWALESLAAGTARPVRRPRTAPGAHGSGGLPARRGPRRRSGRRGPGAAAGVPVGAVAAGRRPQRPGQGGRYGVAGQGAGLRARLPARDR